MKHWETCGIEQPTIKRQRDKTMKVRTTKNTNSTNNQTQAQSNNIK